MRPTNMTRSRTVARITPEAAAARRTTFQRSGARGRRTTEEGPDLLIERPNLVFRPRKRGSGIECLFVCRNGLWVVPAQFDLESLVVFLVVLPRNELEAVALLQRRHFVGQRGDLFIAA